jgi:hypothetical protein
MWGSYRDRITATRGYTAVVVLAALLAWPVLRPAPTAPVPGPPGIVAAGLQAQGHASHGFGRGRSRPDSAQHVSTPSTTFVAEGSAAAPVLAPLGTAPVLRSGAARTVGVRLASSRAPPARRGC